MKFLRPYSNLCLYTSLILMCLYLYGCLEFESIDQPSSILPGEIFTVFIEATVESNDEGESGPYFGICLPNGWTIPGDTIVCTGVYGEAIVYDSNLALEQENLSPAPEGCYWWVGNGNEILSPVHGTAYGEIQIQTDEQVGLFSLDYMLGNSHDGLNQQRSNGHLVEVIVDVHAPTGLQAIVEEESVVLNWSAPHTSEGLIGYLIFRDGEVINNNVVVDDFYLDNNPGVGIHNYTLASLYNDGNVYFAQDILDVFVCAGGMGEPGDPFQIATANQLTAIGSHPSLLDKNYVLISNIDLDPSLPGRKVFTGAVIVPDTSDVEAGFQGSLFTGVFDGDGHTVSNLTIDGDSFLGLFGALGPEAKVIDVNVVNVDVTGNGWNIGAIAGTNRGTLQECYSSGLVTGYSDVGGLVGSNNNGQIIDSHSTAVVVGMEYVGGLVGSQLANYTEGAAVLNSSATGDVFGWYWIGGLVGFNHGTIRKCSASSFVNGSSSLGGLVGYNDTAGLLSNCYSCSTVHGEDALGGLVGSNMGSIHFTYSTGEVVGVSHIGGLVGISDAQAEVIASFWDMELSGQPSSGGGTGLTTAELQDLNTYIDAGWDFAGESENGIENIWYLTSDGPAQFFYFEGTGTQDDPYQIDTVWHLTSIGSDPNMLDKHFKLTQHIDLDPNQLGSRVFRRPLIASDYYENHFTGTFDGCGYEIRNLNISGSENTGLFGYLGSTAQISNLSIVDAHVESSSGCDRQGILAGVNSGTVLNCHTSGFLEGIMDIGGLIGYNCRGNVRYCSSMADVKGSGHIGGLVGWNAFEGLITDCYSNGVVNGTGWTIGGLVGLNSNNAQVDKSYSTGTVTGDHWVGGLLGSNSNNCHVSNCCSTGAVTGGHEIGGLVGKNDGGEISKCYSIGAVTGDEDIGGLVGWNNWSVVHSFWDIETSGQSRSEGGIGLTTARMQDIDTYLNAGWDFFGREFNGTEDIWVMETYPVLYTSQLPGKGTIESPYLISDNNKLIAFKNMLPSAHYRLTEDIDLCGSQWGGPLLDEYSGTFDGGGFSIRNLTIIGDRRLGLFGALGLDATIKNLTIENVFVEGSEGAIGGLIGKNYGFVTHCECTGVVTGAGNYVGGLVGQNWGHVSDCSSTATVTGENHTGGLAGSNFKGHYKGIITDGIITDGIITASYSTGSVSGGDRVGGLVGWNDDGSITSSYSTGAITGNERVGGMVGDNRGSITSSYSTGSVNGDSRVGGLVGRNTDTGNITSSYSTDMVSGDDRVGGLVGNNKGSITSSYSTGYVNGNDEVGGLVGNNRGDNAIVSTCFWDTETSGRTNMCGIQEEGATGCDDSFGLTTAEMQTASTFLDAGWDFVGETENGTEDIWWIIEGLDYPRLWWELIPEN